MSRAIPDTGAISGGPEPPTPAAPAGRLAGLTNAEVIALKANAMKQHVFHGAPLISAVTGEAIADAV